MFKKILMCLLTVTFFITGCNKEIKQDNLDNTSKESDIVMKLNITIDNKNYILNLEDNATVKEFINVLPKTLMMNELNNNEKYVYLDESFTTNSFNPKTINKGDVMLYGNNCLVIFYKTFDTNYSYTKIGHIDNLEELGNGSINVIINK